MLEDTTLREGTRKPKDKKNPVQLIWGESKNIATDVSAIDGPSFLMNFCE